MLTRSQESSASHARPYGSASAVWRVFWRRPPLEHRGVPDYSRGPMGKSEHGRLGPWQAGVEGGGHSSPSAHRPRTSGGERPSTTLTTAKGGSADDRRGRES